MGSLEAHAAQYKNKGLTQEVMRRRREEFSVRLRKEKREEHLAKRRAVLDAMDKSLPDSSNEAKQSNNAITPEILQALAGDDEAQRLEATKFLRKLLSSEPHPPIAEVIAADIVPWLVQFLYADNSPELQLEASWALTNIASGTSEQTRVVVECGAVPILVGLLNSPYENVKDQSVWALGNIAGDSPACRDVVLQCGVVPALVQMFKNVSKISTIRNAIWTISNLCRGKNSPPSFDQVKDLMPILVEYLYNDDPEIVTDACWSLSYIADGPEGGLQAVADSGAFPYLPSLLLHHDPSVVAAALRTVGNVVTGDDEQTDVVLCSSALFCFPQLLKSKETIRREACWTLSNITAGNRAQVKAVVDAGLVPTLVDILKTADYRTRKEAAWALINAACGGSNASVCSVVDAGAIPPLCDMLTVNDSKVVLAVLTGLRHILKVGEATAGQSGTNRFALMVEECNGLDKIEYLQSHQNEEVYKSAFALLDAFFLNDDNQQTSFDDAPEEFNF